jgi:sugar (pentulose or hexulose) kinase
MDQAVGAIGAGNYRPGIISETTGAALAIQITIPRPDIDRSRRISVNIHSVPGMYLFQPFCPTAGLALQWFREVFGEPEISTARLQGKDAYDVLTDMAALASPGCDGLLMLPHLSGSLTPIVNSAARSFSGFSLAHQKSPLCVQSSKLLHYAASQPGGSCHWGSTCRLHQWRWRTQQIMESNQADVCNIPVVSLASEGCFIGRCT